MKEKEHMESIKMKNCYCTFTKKKTNLLMAMNELFANDILFQVRVVSIFRYFNYIFREILFREKNYFEII